MLAPGTAVYLEAHHLCTQMRAFASRTHDRTTAYRGAYVADPTLRSDSSAFRCRRRGR
jgi:GTP cyclohydrolase I